MQYLERILGTWLGKAAGLLFLFFYLHINGNIVKFSQELVTANFLHLTPIIVVSGGFIFISGCAVRGGLEVIARSAQILVPIVILFTVLVFVLLTPDLEIQRMLPVLAKGIGPTLMGAVVPTAWFSHLILISYLYPFLKDKEKGMKWGMISVFAAMFLLSFSNLYTLLLFGNLTGSFTYPVMQAARFISIADFLEHLESLVVVIWVAGVYLKISFFYYVLVLGTAQWFKLDNYKPIVFPIGALLLAFALWSGPSLQDLHEFISKATPFYSAIVHILFPVLLFCIALLRKHGRKTTNV